MPNYKGHLLGGCVAYGILLSCITFPYSLVKLIEYLCFTLLGALFPDIDTKSKGQKIFFKIITVSSMVLFFQKKYYEIAILSLLAFLPLLVPHRGLFHKLWFIMFFLVVIIFFTNLTCGSYYSLIINNLVFFMAGVVSHLWLDLGFRRMLKR